MMLDAGSAPATDDEVLRRLDEQQLWIADVATRASRHRILSTLPYDKVEWWVKAVDTILPRRNLLAPLTRAIGVPDIFIVARLLLRAPRYDLVLLTGGERADLIYAALAAACPWLRTPHVIVDAQWQQAAGWGHLLQRWLLRASRRLAAQVQPHSDEEVALYHRLFGIPLQRLRPIPWSTSLLGYRLAPSDGDGDFVLTGGDAFRDYAVFLEAAGELGLPVKVALHHGKIAPALQTLAARFPSVRLHNDWSHEDFLGQMAACRLFAMPIAPGVNRAIADPMILNAMHFGKVVVASDSISPRIYIRNGVNGLVVPDGTVEAWAASLSAAWQLDADAYRRIGRQAHRDARVSFNEPIRMARILDAALTVVRGGKQSPQPLPPDRPAGR